MCIFSRAIWGIFVHPVIAGAMAYLVALQLLLPGLVLAQATSGAPDHSAICAYASDVQDGSYQHPVNHHVTCVCCACADAASGAMSGPIPTSHEIVWLDVYRAYHFANLTNCDLSFGHFRSGPHNPRAPPAA
jgi:hypothetical protein